jgi:molybdopterin-containing oxidoreductase family membrane subunit
LKFPLLVVALVVALAVGAYATWIKTTEGLGVSALTDIVSWGLYVSMYIYFIGLSAGAFLLSSVIYVFGVKRFEPIGKHALLLAILCLVVALILIDIDLGNPDRMINLMIWRNPTSVLSWEAQLFQVYLAILIVELWLLMRPDFVRSAPQSVFYRILTLGSSNVSEQAVARDKRIVRTLGAIGIPVALGVHGGLGAIFAVAEARPFWFSPLVPVVFVVSALASGTALLAFLLVLNNRFGSSPIDGEIVSGLGRMALWFLFADVFLVFWEYLVGFYSTNPQHSEPVRLILFGPFAWVFWGFQIGLGTVIPIAILAHPRLRLRAGWVGIGSFFLAAGILAVRFNIVIPPMSIPVLEGLHPEALAVVYFPTLLEWLSVMGPVALGALVYVLGLKILPIRAPSEPSLKLTRQ